IGSEVDITSILFGEVSVGYTWRHYDSSQLNDANGWGADSKLTWNVTPLTSVVLNASTGIDETTVIFEGDAATANLQNTVVLDVTHELLRNVLLNANVGYARDDFEGTGRTDNIYSAGTGVSYLLNRNLSLDARYRFTKRDSDDKAIEFNRNIVLVGVTAKL
ncbi:MAG: outer membrane beta-barrel protein, partial [Geminicoccaceae bacterium]